MFHKNWKCFLVIFYPPYFLCIAKFTVWIKISFSQVFVNLPQDLFSLLVNVILNFQNFIFFFHFFLLMDIETYISMYNILELKMYICKSQMFTEVEYQLSRQPVWIKWELIWAGLHALWEVYIHWIDWTHLYTFMVIVFINYT